MITLRPASERGHFDFGWLDTFHTFSFGEYFDPAWTSFRSLRVLNDDVIAPATGFGPHPHRDMEIVTWVLSGALEHGDNIGNGGVIRPGEVQRMSAGRGIVHSERNASDTEPLRLLQIWLLPREARLDPGYEQKAIPDTELRGRLRLVASPDGRDGSVTIHQDARILVARLAAGESVEEPIAPGRGAFVQVAKGEVELDGRPMAQGDGAALTGEAAVRIRAVADDSEVLVFDLA